MEERVGFEPTTPIPRSNGFQDRRFRPLSHLSAVFSSGTIFQGWPQGASSDSPRWPEAAEKASSQGEALKTIWALRAISCQLCLDKEQRQAPEMDCTWRPTPLSNDKNGGKLSRSGDHRILGNGFRFCSLATEGCTATRAVRRVPSDP